LSLRSRQVIVGLVMFPLSLLPFLAYFRQTPEGRLLWTRATIGVFRPELPALTKAEARRFRKEAPRYSGGVAVLVYHGIGSSTDAEGRFSLSVSQFGAQLNALRAAGMHFVTARRLADDYRHHRAPPPNAVMVTFDDGRAEAMMLADPLLREAHARATMFVITDRASDHGLFYASSDALRGYAKSGRWDLESHTAGQHVMQPTRSGPLPRLTSTTRGESISAFRRRVTADLDRADAELVRLSGRRPVAFAYPFGAYGADRSNNPHILAVLRRVLRRRYALAFQQDDQETIPLATCVSPRLTLRRLDVRPWSGSQLLAQLRHMTRETKFDARCPGTSPHTRRPLRSP
jgi:peptidoglycan/xylan/chitin deacetylase (PgdA/CDA1 family)